MSQELLAKKAKFSDGSLSQDKAEKLFIPPEAEGDKPSAEGAKPTYRVKDNADFEEAKRLLKVSIKDYQEGIDIKVKEYQEGSGMEDESAKSQEYDRILKNNISLAVYELAALITNNQNHYTAGAEYATINEAITTLESALASKHMEGHAKEAETIKSYNVSLFKANLMASSAKRKEKDFVAVEKHLDKALQVDQKVILHKFLLNAFSCLLGDQESVEGRFTTSNKAVQYIIKYKDVKSESGEKDIEFVKSEWDDGDIKSVLHRAGADLLDQDILPVEIATLCEEFKDATGGAKDFWVKELERANKYGEELAKPLSAHYHLHMMLTLQKEASQKIDAKNALSKLFEKYHKDGLNEGDMYLSTGPDYEVDSFNLEALGLS